MLDDYEGFRVLVRGTESTSPVFRISFDSVLAYSCVEESSAINDSRRAPGLSAPRWCFVVKNSWYLEEFHEISSGIRRDQNIVHYALYLSNQLIDVLAEGEARVENLND